MELYIIIILLLCLNLETGAGSLVTLHFLISYVLHKAVMNLKLKNYLVVLSDILLVIH